jgi:hypothetical protein
MRNLAKIACAVLLSAGLSAPAFAAETDTERGQTPAAPSVTGADNQPNKPPTAVMSKGAATMSNGAKEEKKGVPETANNPGAAAPGSDNGGSKP